MNPEADPDSPVYASSTMYGADADIVAFNLAYIAVRDPNLLIDILANFKAANNLKGKPTIDEKDTQMLIALERFQRLFKTYLI